MGLNIFIVVSAFLVRLVVRIIQPRSSDSTAVWLSFLRASGWVL